MKLADYELLYDLPAGEYDGRGLDGVKTVTYRAGRSLEVLCHPITTLSREARREVKRRKSTPAMERLNARNTERHVMRLLEANFTAAAYFVTGTYAYPMEDYGLCNLAEISDTYEKRGLPWEAERVRMDVRNLTAKLRRRVVKAAGTAEGFKWLYCIEEGKQPPAEGLPRKYHFHGVIEGPGLSREIIEALWPHGYVRAIPFKLEDDGPARLARYIRKQRKGGRWWSHSRNLISPPPRESVRKVSRRRLSRIAADVQRDGREILEKLYPGYKAVEINVHYSDFAAGAFIYARLRKKTPARGTGASMWGGPPPRLNRRHPMGTEGVKAFQMRGIF